MADDEQNRGHWSLDKRVPVALIFGLLMQTAAVAYWVAGVENRGLSNERRIAVIESAVQQVPERLTRIETTMTLQFDQVVRELRRLERAGGDAGNGHDSRP
jgi:hypothetical protein